VKSADENLQAPSAKFPGKICGSGKLIGLDSNQRNNCSPIRELIRFDDSTDWYFLNGIIDEFDLELNFRPEQPAPCHVLRKAGKARQRIAWEHTAKMTDDIPFIIVFGWLYEYYFNLLPFKYACCRAFHNLSES
jgi:hypothetical protein